MESNITIIGPRAIGKSTVCKGLAFEHPLLTYIEFDAFLDKYLSNYGGLINALSTGVAQGILNQKMPDEIEKILSEERILLDLGGGAISSMHDDTNRRNLTTILERSKVIPLIYSFDINRSSKVLHQRELQRPYRAKSFLKVLEDYKRFLTVIQKNNLSPLICYGKTVEKIISEISKKFKRL